MVISHSYVSLPEGTVWWRLTTIEWHHIWLFDQKGRCCMSAPGEWWPCGSLSNCTQAPRTSYPHRLDKSQEKIDLEKKACWSQQWFLPRSKWSKNWSVWDKNRHGVRLSDCQCVSSLELCHQHPLHPFFPSPRTQWDQEKVGARRKAFASTGGLWRFFMVFSHAQYGWKSAGVWTASFKSSTRAVANKVGCV